VSDEDPGVRPAPAQSAGQGAEERSGRRTDLRTFLKEVRGELRRVAWPSRRVLASYSVVVIVAVSILTAFIFALDQVFGQLTLWVFG
jgi:preprotein translocase subunit SecE